MTKIRLIFFVLLTTLVFSGIFSLKYLTRLDSVYFYKESYFDLTNKINLWNSFNSPLGGVEKILWLYPITYLAGLIGKWGNIDWNILVRFFFYIPSIFLSFYSIQKLVNSFKIGTNGKFLASLIYVFNTYFLMLVDGGQLGIMLAYSIFPLAVESILNLSFFRTAAILALIAIFDPRFLVLALITGLVINKFNFKNIFKLLPMMLVVLLINSFWIIPLLKAGTINVSTFVSELKLTSLFDALMLYQPHWPYNEFGKVTSPSILFFVYPILLAFSFLYKPTKEKIYWLFIFMFFVFLVKGESNPFGFIYSNIVNSHSFMFVFRDSTKFFAPLIVLYILITAKYYDGIKNKHLQWVIPILVFTPLISGLILGVKNNLRGTEDVGGLLKLKEDLKSNNFSRTIYIPQKPQLVFQTKNNQAIDGRVLTDYLPFASDNYGSEDRFNFMQRDNYINYFRSLGIKNLVYISSKKPEVVTIENPMPERYYIDKMAVVVGSPIGVEKLVPEYGVMFVEDGKTDLKRLLEVANDQIFFILNNKNLNDLILSGLKDNFIDPSTLTENNWGKYAKDDYLTWKYQLLIREIDTKEINFDSGIILSTIKGETVKIKYNFKGNTKYKIFVRAIAGDDSDGIYIDDYFYKIPKGNIFNWVSNDLVFDKNTESVTLKNNGGFNVIGSILIIEESKYQNYYSEIKKKLENYKIDNLSSKLPVSKIDFEPKNGWLILNQSYNEAWRLGSLTPFAINSITNGFAVNDEDLNAEISFSGQETLDQSVKISLASVLVFIVSYLGYTAYGYFQKRQKNH